MTKITKNPIVLNTLDHSPMALCVEVGNNTSAMGLCCIAIGDNQEALGAFQVKVGDQVTLPESLKPSDVKILVPQFKKLIAIYRAMTDQGHAPPDFASRAESALNIAIGAFEKKAFSMIASEQSKPVSEEKH